MSTKLYEDIVYGPIKSRRLGLSLGVNLSPVDGKCCTFDCVYCECGLNSERKPRTAIPSRKLIIEALEFRLKALLEEGLVPNRLTFAGNGEPTLHPEFADIVDDVIHLRNILIPETKISIFSNSTTLNRKGVYETLLRIDERIMKLDGGTEELITLIDSPNVSFTVDGLVSDLSRFEGNLTIQTMLLRGVVDGKSVDNTTDEAIASWLELLKKINPKAVMIYTISRGTPIETLEKLMPHEMDHIAEIVRKEGFEVQVSY